MFKTENKCKIVAGATDCTRHTGKTRTKDPREDPLTQDIKNDPTNEYSKMEPITEDPKEDHERTSLYRTILNIDTM